MNAIVVTDKNWAIGRDGGLLFSLPTDMKRFRTLTMGGTVILGRRTLVSFPGGKPLPDRRNIVISHDGDLLIDHAEIAATPEEAVSMTAGDDPDKIWAIGGGSIYAALLARCKRVYLTLVDAAVEEPDTYFPNLDKLPGWEMVSSGEPMEENGLTFRFIDYINSKI